MFPNAAGQTVHVCIPSGNGNKIRLHTRRPILSEISDRVGHKLESTAHIFTLVACNYCKAIGFGTRRADFVPCDDDAMALAMALGKGGFDAL